MESTKTRYGTEYSIDGMPADTAGEALSSAKMDPPLSREESGTCLLRRRGRAVRLSLRRDGAHWVAEIYWNPSPTITRAGASLKEAIVAVLVSWDQAMDSLDASHRRSNAQHIAEIDLERGV